MHFQLQNHKCLENVVKRSPSFPGADVIMFISFLELDSLARVYVTYKYHVQFWMPKSKHNLMTDYDLQIVHQTFICLLLFFCSLHLQSLTNPSLIEEIRMLTSLGTPNYILGNL